jgi:hypothetical protein
MHEGQYRAAVTAELHGTTGVEEQGEDAEVFSGTCEAREPPTE